MNILGILNGNISSREELNMAIEIFRESAEKDSLSNAIISKWEELGKPYLSLNETSDFYEYAPNEMKIFILHESVIINNPELNETVDVSTMEGNDLNNILGSVSEDCQVNNDKYYPSPLSLDYYSKNTNGGVHDYIKEDLDKGYIPRVSDVYEVYDPSKNSYYNEKMNDKDHMLFALKLLIWRLSNNREIVKDDYMTNEWNSRVKRYYDEMISASTNNLSNKYLENMQKLDDICFCPYMNPNNNTVKEINIVSRNNPQSINYGILPSNNILREDVGVSADYTITTDLAEIDENATELTDNQDALINGTPNLSYMYNEFAKDNDLSALLYISKLIEVKYMYCSCKLDETSIMLSFREKILKIIGDSSTEMFMTDFQNSVYYKPYTELSQKIQYVSNVICHCIEK